MSSLTTDKILEVLSKKRQLEEEKEAEVRKKNKVDEAAKVEQNGLFLTKVINYKVQRYMKTHASLLSYIKEEYADINTVMKTALEKFYINTTNMDHYITLRDLFIEKYGSEIKKCINYKGITYDDPNPVRIFGEVFSDSDIHLLMNVLYDTQVESITHGQLPYVRGDKYVDVKIIRK